SPRPRRARGPAPTATRRSRGHHTEPRARPPHAWPQLHVAMARTGFRWPPGAAGMGARCGARGPRVPRTVPLRGDRLPDAPRADSWAYICWSGCDGLGHLMYGLGRAQGDEGHFGRAVEAHGSAAGAHAAADVCLYAVVDVGPHGVATWQRTDRSNGTDARQAQLAAVRVSGQQQAGAMG